MSGPFIDFGCPCLLAFAGPDAERFLNGQITQYVRLLRDDSRCLPACVTDAKGRIQFRVWIWKHAESLMLQGETGQMESLEARLTKYLIADDVEVEMMGGQWKLLHFPCDPGPAPQTVFARSANRYAVAGVDWWFPAAISVEIPVGFDLLDGDALETWRILQGVPLGGNELKDGPFPAEVGLDASDVSFHKGCYIGQEVISRIEHTGKLNRSLARLSLPSACTVSAGPMHDAAGKETGLLTSIAPHEVEGSRPALGFIKRGSTEWFRDGVPVGLRQA